MEEQSHLCVIVIIIIMMMIITISWKNLSFGDCFLQNILMAYLGSGKFIQLKTEQEKLSWELFVFSWTTINVNFNRYFLTWQCINMERVSSGNKFSFFLFQLRKSAVSHHRVIELMDNGAPETINGVTMSPTTMASNTKTTLCEDA